MVFLSETFMKNVTCIAILATTLTACGGGGGGSDSANITANTTNSGYTGKRDLATLNTSNQRDMVVALEMTLLGYSPTTDAAARPDANIGIPSEAMLSPIGQQHVLINRVVGSRLTQQRYQARAFNSSETCTNGGSVSTNGDLNDQTGQGTVTMHFNQCREDEVVLNGSATVQVNKVDWNVGALTDYQLTAAYGMTYGGTTYNVTGIVKVKSDPYAWYVNATSNALYTANGRQILNNNITLTVDPSGLALGGQLCDSTHGCANISTPKKFSLTYGDGQVVLTGANNSKLRFRTENGIDWIDLDADGDGRYETVTRQ